MVTRRRAIAGSLTILGALLSAAVLAAPARAASEYNLPYGVTPISHAVYRLHMLAFWMMCGIGLIVFGLIFYSVIFHRRSRHPVPAKFHENTVLEIVWTILPFFILVILAVPAARLLLRMENLRHSQLTVRITGYQWLWRYTYPRYGINVYSRLSNSSLAAVQYGRHLSPYAVPHYLRSVSHPMVVPTGEKIRLLVTGGDVIHAWWVPALGLQIDANPGLINAMWIKILKPGVYRGACNQICGWGHGYMPIVVVAKPPQQFLEWVRHWRAMHRGPGQGDFPPHPLGL